MRFEDDIKARICCNRFMLKKKNSINKKIYYCCVVCDKVVADD